MKTILIFAAGRGQRLRPITDVKPKSLCEIQEKTLLDHHLEKLNNTGPYQVFINHAYLGYQIKRHLKTRHYPNLEIHFLPEPPGGYETGGTLLYFLEHIYTKKEPLITLNADIFTDYDFSSLNLPHKNSMAHLVLVEPSKHHKRNDFSLTRTQHVQNQEPNLIFSGIACYHPDFFKHRTGKRVSLIPWLKAGAENNLVTGELHQGIWFDIGSTARLNDARKLTKN